MADSFTGDRVRVYGLFTFPLSLSAVCCRLVIGPGLQLGCLYGLNCLGQVRLMRNKLCTCVILSILAILQVHIPNLSGFPPAPCLGTICGTSHLFPGCAMWKTCSGKHSTRTHNYGFQIKRDLYSKNGHVI